MSKKSKAREIEILRKNAAECRRFAGLNEGERAAEWTRRAEWNDEQADERERSMKGDS